MKVLLSVQTIVLHETQLVICGTIFLFISLNNQITGGFKPYNNCRVLNIQIIL
jgi:hypothetical protein